MNKRNIDAICSAVCEEFCITPETLRSGSKRQVHTWPRAMAIYIAYSRGELTEDIAEYFGMSRQMAAYYIRRGGGNVSRNAGDRCRYERIIDRLENNESQTI